MTGAITWEVVSAFILVAGFVGGYSYRLQNQLGKLRDRIEKNGQELAEYKLDAARQFVSLQHMEQFESRMLGAINRLADRLDRIIERSKE